eukprot:9386823-Karenia_brevis.AAC.1
MQTLKIHKNRGARTADERIHWSLQALRAIQDGNGRQFEEALQAAPQLNRQDSFPSQLPTTTNHITHIRDVLSAALS